MGDSILKIAAVAGEQLVYLVLAGSFFVYLVRKKVFSNTVLFLGLLFAANLATFFLGQRFYGHYFIQAIPPMVLCCTALYSMFSPSGLFYRKTVHIALAVSLLFLVFNIWHSATRAHPVPGSQIVAYLKNLDSRSTIFYWNPSKRVMFYAGHSFATRFIQSNYQTGKLWGTIYRTKAATPEMTKKMEMKESWDMLMFDLKNEKPDYIVEPAPEHNKFSSDKYPLLDNFIKAGYIKDTVLNGYIVYKKKK